MAYWEDKRAYEEEMEEKHVKKSFCNVCGRKLTERNVKGRCVECEEVVCSFCGKIFKGKVVCSDCKEGIEKNEEWGTGLADTIRGVKRFFKELKKI